MAKQKKQKPRSQTRNANSVSEVAVSSNLTCDDNFSYILRKTDDLFSQIKKVTAVQLTSVSLREDVKNLVKDYFRILRPELFAGQINTDELDQQMQELMGMCNSNTSLSVYKKSFSIIRQHLVRIEGEKELLQSRVISKTLSISSRPTDSGRDTVIIGTLEKTVPTAAVCYRQALEDVGKPRISYRGTVSEFREVLREVLDYLAPDKDVKSIPGFKLEDGTKGPTMKQKVRYILKSRKKSATAIEVPEEAVLIVDEGIAKLVRATYNRGSLSTHTQGEGLPEVLQIKMYLDSVLCELLEIH